MKGNARTLDDVVDGLGVNFGQYIIVLCGGEVYSGLIKTLVTVSSTSFANDLGFSSLERGWLVSMLFLGNFVGNLASGATADCFGRRFTLLLGYAVALVSLALSTFAHSFALMFVCRSCFGISAGLMGPTCWTLLGELSPAKSRMWMHMWGHLMWYAGAFSILLIVHTEDPTMQSVPWRGMTMFVLSTMVVTVLLSVFFVVESPSFLSRQGRREEAIESLEVLRRRNGADVDVRDWQLRPCEAVPSEESWSYASLFTRSSIFTTVTLCMCAFSLNYSSYGMLYALPIILQKSHLDVVPSAVMLMNLVCGFIGICLSIPASTSRLSRVKLLGVVMAARAVCCLIFLLGLWQKDGGALMTAVTLFGIFGKTLLDSIVFVLVYLYAIEVKGTGSRASSSGLALAVGRLGGAFAPVAFELFPHKPIGFILTVCVLAFACAGLVLGLPIETKDRQLGEIEDEVAPLSSRKA